jgi:hypothetical protein
MISDRARTLLGLYSAIICVFALLPVGRSWPSPSPRRTGLPPEKWPSLK